MNTLDVQDRGLTVTQIRSKDSPAEYIRMDEYETGYSYKLPSVEEPSKEPNNACNVKYKFFSHPTKYAQKWNNGRFNTWARMKLNKLCCFICALFKRKTKLEV